MKVVAEVMGLADLTARLRQIPNELEQEKVLAKALRDGAKVVRQQAEANLVASGAVDTGLLAHTMQIVQPKQDLPGHVEVVLKPSSKLSMVVRKGKTKPTRARPSKYAHFIEYGTEHSAAKPFLRPAADAKGGEAGEVIAAEVEKGVAAAARKVGL